MISMKNLKNLAQAASYYERDDYYTRAQSPSGWLGKTARELGLQGPVDRAQFRELLDGKLPEGIGQGEVLPRKEKRKLGFDFTLSAPKSVSLVALVSGDKRVREAHVQAVEKAVAWFEEHAVEARITVNGVTRSERTGNILAARFDHDTSRELDPQLHSHAVILNITRRRDGALRAVDNRKLYEDNRVASAVYKAELAAGLQRLGYRIEQTHPDGRFEIQGISREQIEHFSKRRSQIVAALADRDLSSYKAADIAAVDSRKAKREVDRAALHKAWRAQAREVGLNLETVRRGARRHRGKLEPGREAAEQALSLAVDHLAERKAVFSLEELTREALERGVGRLDLGSFERAIEAPRSEELARKLVRTGAGEYTTTEALRLERKVLRLAQEGRGRFVPVVDEKRLLPELVGLGLNRDQTQAVRLLLTSPDQVVGVQGYAGTGKTTMLRTFREQAEAAGHRVLGLSNTASAAHLLEQETGMPASTTARHLLEQARKQPREQDFLAPAGDARPDIWVVDEASMLSNKEAARLLDLAKKKRARVVLVGDQAQLPAIEAGRPFGLLQHKQKMAVAVMKTIVRQAPGAHKQAIEATIGGRVERARELLSDSIFEEENRDKRLDRVAQDYLYTFVRTGSRPMAITGLNRDRVALNERIRQGLRDQGELRGASVQARVLVPRSYTEAELSDRRSYLPGDLVRFGRTYRSLGVETGELARIRRIDPGSHQVVLLRENGQEMAFQPGRITRLEVYREEARDLAQGDLIRWTRNDPSRGRRNGEQARVVAVDPENREATIERNGKHRVLKLDEERHWEHGYASTIHAAQGQSPDEVLVHLDTSKKKVIGHEAWYVAITRGKQAVRIYTDSKERLPEAIQRSMEQRSALVAMEQEKEKEHERRDRGAAAERDHQGHRGGQRRDPEGHDGRSLGDQIDLVPDETREGDRGRALLQGRDFTRASGESADASVGRARSAEPELGWYLRPDLRVVDSSADLRAGGRQESARGKGPVRQKAGLHDDHPHDGIDSWLFPDLSAQLESHRRQPDLPGGPEHGEPVRVDGQRQEKTSGRLVGAGGVEQEEPGGRAGTRSRSIEPDDQWLRDGDDQSAPERRLKEREEEETPEEKTLADRLEDQLNRMEARKRARQEERERSMGKDRDVPEHGREKEESDPSMNREKDLDLEREQSEEMHEEHTRSLGHSISFGM